MKLLSIAIPCYNSAAYMRHCIESLLVGGEDIEILIVNDGSTKDNTGEIAEEYANKYPGIVKAIQKENGGHGSAVNAGLEQATGLYFKVVDSDDWVQEDSYKEILAALKNIVGGDTVLDMLISNFVYEKEGEPRKKVMQYKSVFPQETIFTWNDVKRFAKGTYILMHSVIYRTKLLQDSGLKLPEHTFYVDNIYVFNPLPYVKTMYYINTNFYRYYIGREDQSVNEKIMISRIDQQILVNKLMIEFFLANRAEIKKTKRVYQYMKNHIEIVTVVSSILLIRAGTEEALEKKKELWLYIKEADNRLFFWLRNGIMGSSMNLPGRGGRKISVKGYNICQKIFHFN